MDKIALLGPGELVLPLASSGIDAVGCRSGAEAADQIRKIAGRGEHLIILITEGIAMECLDEIENSRECLNFVFLPDNRGSSGLFFEKTNKLIKEAIGVSQND